MNHRPFPRKHNFIPHKRGTPVEHFAEPFEEPSSAQYLVHPEQTGAEAEYLQSLVDAHTKVSVRLISGETLHGHIRYYDQHCFSLGLSDAGPRIFIRKTSISYISEE
jgi:small nuclear ribonucleoprotein (snRNP)-like protein